MNIFLEQLKELSKEQIILLGLSGAILVAMIILASGVLTPPLRSYPKTEPVYEVELANTIRFKLQEVKDRGDVLKLTESNNPKLAKKDATTTGRFIEVTVSAENIGKNDLRMYSWDIRDLYDSDGAKFYSNSFYNYWASENIHCGDLLKPKFPPVLCSKIYEVSKASTGLKVETYLKDNKKTAYIDLGL